jgi:hypothetical protein
MANLVPLNTFKTLTSNVYTSLTTVYTTPIGVSTVVLLAQFANIGANTDNVTAYHSRSGVDVPLAVNFKIPPNDAASLLTGRIILESGDLFKISAGANNAFKFTFSYLETANA